MTAAELRIGNYVNDDSEKGLMIVSAIKSREYNEWNSGDAYSIVCLKAGYNDSYYEGDFKPIPLTEEWLIKFGFKKHKAGIGGADMWQGMDGWSINESGWLFRGNPKNGLKLTGYWNSNIQYVHQLQNLYWCLFQTELTFSNP
jgi:hypothetical protein